MGIEQGDDEFDAGFGDDVVVPTARPEHTESDDLEDNPAPAGTAKPEQRTEEAPEYVQITKKEWDEVRSKATAIDEIKAATGKQLDTAFGKIGGIERLVNQLQQQTPNGQAVEITEDDFAELKAEWPEVADMSLKGFNRVLSKLKGTGNPTATIDVDKLVSERVAPEIEKVRQEYRSEITDLRLSAHHKDWNQVINSQDFMAWEKTLPAEEQQKFLSSSDPEYVAEVITKFKAAKQAASEKSRKNSTRQELIEAAVTPRGTGGHAPAPSEDDEFDAGFKSG